MMCVCVCVCVHIFPWSQYLPVVYIYPTHMLNEGLSNCVDVCPFDSKTLKQLKYAVIHPEEDTITTFVFRVNPTVCN